MTMQDEATVRSAIDSDEVAAEPKVRLGLRDRIPRAGLTEYWYPAIPASKVGKRRGVARTLLGQDLVFFRGKHGEIAAIGQWCPHRNASLGGAPCFFEGTITCPYHGLTFDHTGTAIAFLGEGVDSTLPGQPGANARSYPTRTLQGLVFVWMGKGAPAPIEEDVPPEFLDPNALVQFTEDTWSVNWRASLENLNDAHVFYVHRNSLEVLMLDRAGLQLFLDMGATRPPTKVVNDRGLVFENPRFFDFTDSQQARKTKPRENFQDEYPQLGGAKWPKTRFRLYLANVMGFLRRNLRPKKDWLIEDQEWAGVHLPTTFRVDYQTHIYSRAVTPIDAETSKIFYYNTTYPGTSRRRFYNRVIYRIYYDWKQHRNFSGQDQRIVEGLKYENQHEKFSGSDAFPLAWRKFVVQYARRAPDGTIG
jgi:phenylpropionate dioxygenase-like ring-hydroxylating dioxygenase large terminal subunit